MSFSHYLDLQLAISSVILFMGFSYIFDTIPARLRRSLYDVSRKFIGTAYIVYALSTYIYCFSDMRFKPDCYGIALNLTAYYIILIMLRHTFVPLLGRKVNYNEPSFLRDILYCFLFPIPMWTAISYGDAIYINYVLIGTNVAFILAMIHQTFIFVKLYRKAISRANNYYSEGIEVKIGWMSTAVKLVVSLGVLGCIAAFVVPHSLAMGYFFMIYCFVIYVYVFKSFHNFMFTYTNEEETDVDEINILDLEGDEFVADGLNSSNPDAVFGQKWFGSETYQLLQKRVNEWIADEGYTQKGITIMVVASKVYTNRTYLSNYINSTYNCSFKIWITRLRINKAKELLSSDLNVSIGEVSDQVGCSSSNSFNHLFKQSENVSPAKWRAMYRSSIDNGESKSNV